jgi:CBS domain-containing protein
MAAIFAGASHALLASVVFAFETTRQPAGLLPLLAGCTAAYLPSLLMSRHSIMTEKLARRGASVRTEYAADHLAHVLVRDAATRTVALLRADDTLAAVRGWLTAGEHGATHQGFPVLDAAGRLVGVVTRRDLLDPDVAAERTVGSIVRRPAVVVYDDSTLRDAADHMVVERVGRLPVVTRAAPLTVVGILTRSDILAAHAPRLRAARLRPHRRRLLRRW